MRKVFEKNLNSKTPSSEGKVLVLAGRYFLDRLLQSVAQGQQILALRQLYTYISMNFSELGQYLLWHRERYRLRKNDSHIKDG